MPQGHGSEDRLREVAVRDVSTVECAFPLEAGARQPAKWMSASAGRTIHIQNVRVVTGTGRPALEKACVSVSDGRIAAITENLPDHGDQDRLVIDGTGATLVPGLIDAHVHLSGDSDRNPFGRYSNRDLRLLRAAADLSLPMSLGFTTLRDCGLGGFGPELRAAINAGVLVGPRIGTTHRSISETGGPSDWNALPLETTKSQETRGVQADGPWEFVRAVRRNFREGATFIKVFVTRSNLAMPGLWPPKEILSSEELAALVRETHAFGAVCAAHCNGDDGTRRAVEAGADTIEHGIVSDDAVLELMAERGTILVPTLSVFSHGARLNGPMTAQSDVARRLLDVQFEMVSRARELGVRIALGSDTGSGSPFSGQLELELLVEAGLSPMEALTAATSLAAQACGWGDQLGTVEVGKFADLVLVDGKPDQDSAVLTDPARILAVVKSSEIV